jgi:DNA-binding transcriptional ArsR family regulator
VTTPLLDHADELLAALAEPNRRLLLERLGTHGVATATTLAAELPVTRQAVTQHLAVLESVSLVSSARAGLMLILVALSVMSIAWMAIIAVLVVAQKLLPGKAALDVPLALAIVGLGVLIIIAPTSVPGLMPSM